MKEKVRILLVVSMFLPATGSVANAKTIYVDADRPPGGGGTNWTDAYKYLQDALADANTSAKPVEIRVAQGTYKPDEGAGVEDANRTETFQLINGVTLKGGYAGFGEADPNARDITNYETILSGDLDGNDANVSNPADLLDEPTRAENSYHVVSGSGTDANAVLDGFTITAGNANGAAYPDNSAAGLRSSDSTLTLQNCTFVANSASGFYGAMSRWDDLDRIAEISNCNFAGNYTGSGEALGGELMILTDCQFNNNYRGGLYLYNGCSVTNCVFSENMGGGMYAYRGAPVLTNCVFVGNSGGGLYLSCDSSNNPEVTNCIFIDNSYAGNGGGMCISGGGESRVTNCTFIGNSAGSKGGGMFSLHYQGTHPKVTNCIFTGNTASGDGGAVCSAHDYTTFTNCSFTNNQAGGDGGVYCCFETIGSAVFNNCILWGNTASGEGPEIAVKVGTLTVDYSNVQGGKWDIYQAAGATLKYYEPNNIESDPCFVDADGADDIVGTEDDNLRLLADSNCIDAGDNTAVPADTTDLDGDGNTAEPVPYDLDGNPRFIDDLCTTDTGNGTAPVVDMGAYEFLRSDIDSDGDVNFKDFAQFALCWRDVTCGACSGADLTCDGDVDWNDVRELADNWLW